MKLVEFFILTIWHPTLHTFLPNLFLFNDLNYFELNPSLFKRRILATTAGGALYYGGEILFHTLGRDVGSDKGKLFLIFSSFGIFHVFSGASEWTNIRSLLLTLSEIIKAKLYAK